MRYKFPLVCLKDILSMFGLVRKSITSSYDFIPSSRVDISSSDISIVSASLISFSSIDISSLKYSTNVFKIFLFVSRILSLNSVSSKSTSAASCIYSAISGFKPYFSKSARVVNFTFGLSGTYISNVKGERPLPFSPYFLYASPVPLASPE